MLQFYYYNILIRTSVYLLPAFAFAVSSYLRFGQSWFSRGFASEPYFMLLLFTEFVWIVTATRYKLSSATDLFREYTGIRASFAACFVTFCMQATLIVLMHNLNISRLFIGLSNAILFLSALGARNIFRLTAASAAVPSKNILIVGTDPYARRSVKLLRRVPLFHCIVQAYVQLPGQQIRVHGAPVISTDNLGDLESLNFDEIVVAIPATRYLQLSSVLDRLNTLGKPVRAILDLDPRLALSKRLFQVGRLQMMNLAISPVESFAYTVLKRTFDLVGAVLGIILLGPALLLIAVALKMCSPGPILFRQERVGRHGKLFSLLKFRTMQCSNAAESDTHWTAKNDSRCTGVGAFLRKFSLDELPQLVNVIRGDMSLVGPRPERPCFVAKFRMNMHKYNARHFCQVGMTGWAQVNGLRGDTSISDRLRYDLYYIHNWSFGLDLRIIMRTIFTVWKDQNAY